MWKAALTRVRPSPAARVGVRAALGPVARYHSYPDPSEKPVISSSRSEVQKQAQKPEQEFRDMETKFRMDTPLPGVPPSKPVSQLEVPTTRVSTLNNGLVVGSQEVYGMLSSIALIVGSGSSSEKQMQECGLAQMTEAMAFQSTQSRDFQTMAAELERIGGLTQCLTTPESTIYCIDVMRQGLPTAMEILADTVLHPRLDEEELDSARTTLEYRALELPAGMLSKAALMRAAYRGSPLGNFQLCPVELLPNITVAQLESYRARTLFGSNAVLSGAGVEHDEFVELAARHFGDLPAQAGEPFARPQSHYTGGEVREQRELQEPYVRLAVGMEIGGWSDELMVPACVLQMLLGGGSSFSAGGPGKGMYTRLYQELLNKHYWIESAEAFVTINQSTGILGIDGASKAEYIPYLLRVFLEQLALLHEKQVSNVELSRAKNMMKSLMMMQLESRLVIAEDIARQLLEYGHRESPHEMCAKIDAVTADDIQKVARRMFQKPPSIGCVGYDVSKLTDYSEVLQWFGR